MWKYEPFLDFVADLVKVPVVGEVIIINNDVGATPDHPILQHEKVRHFAEEENLFVNPAWNFGVKNARYDKVCIINDDIIVDLKVFYKMDGWLTEDVGAAGIVEFLPDKLHLQPPFVNGSISLTQRTTEICYGFGVLFFIHKNNWVDIPEGLRINFGDNWVFDSQVYIKHKPNYLISDLLFFHAGGQTTSTVQATNSQYHELEEQRYKEVMNELTQQDYRSQAIAILETEYHRACNTPTDINLHLPRLRALAKECSHVTEMGVRDGQSTRALLVEDIVLRSYDLFLDPNVGHLFTIAAQGAGRNMVYQFGNTLVMDIEPTDMLFIDTDHTYAQLSQELARHHGNVRKYLAFHDTHDPFGLELLPAILHFLAAHPEWKVKSHTIENHGFTVLERIA